MKQSDQSKRGRASKVKPAFSGAVVAGLAGLALAPNAAHAAESAASAAIATAAHDISGIDVTSSHSSKAESPKFTAPLIDTPQTVTVVPKAVIEGQNLLTLRDILTTVPGITFGAGEGGGGYGDSINLRGYSANNDITVDGVRDSAQYTRSDPFNLEQLEVINGASSVYNGAGSVGGVINMVSKTPNSRRSTAVSVGAGTADYGRVTVDANQPLSDSIAVRLNVMAHRNDVPGRDYEQFKRWGFAPSVAFGLGSPTRLTLSWYHQQDDNVPQYGVPYYNGAPVPGIDRSSYFGYANVDNQKTNVDTFTATLDHRFSDNFTVRNLSRYQQVEQDIVINAPQQGSYCLPNGLQPVGWSQTATATNLTGYAACIAGAVPGFYTPGGPRGNRRDTTNKLLYNQTDFTVKFNTGGAAHNLVVGVSLLEEDFELSTGNVFRNPNGATPNPTLPLISLSTPNPIYNGPINYIEGSRGYGSRSNQAIYLFDSIEFGPKFQINGGVRYEHNEGWNRTDTLATTPPTTGAITPGQTFANDEHLLSYRIGAIFKPQPNMSFYVAYGNSETPSQQAVNGACNATTCFVEPEQAENIEVGMKWDIAGRLSATAAVFRNARTNYKVASNDPAVPDQQLDGSSRVDGLALGLSGRVTDKWTVFANYTYLKSKVLQGASNFTSGLGQDYTAGDPLLNVPNHAFSIWSTYDITSKFQVGAGVTYTGSFYLTQHTGFLVGTTPTRSTIPLVKSDDYIVTRLMATYAFTPRLNLQLNVNNVFDELYFMRIRNNGWATPGDARQAVLALNYRF